MTAKHPIDLIEPAAVIDSNLLFPIEDGKVDPYRLQLSIAISLKRIADKLDGGHGHELDDMLFNAGRAFENGRNQVR
jgi:hypothetical protein